MDAFDADVLIYAAIPDHPLGRRVAALFPAEPVSKSGARAGVGSVLLVPEVLAKPLEDGEPAALKTLSGFLARLDLCPVDRATGQLATVLAARYSLRAADAVHLATAVTMGAGRFITNNSRDFGGPIEEIDVTFPADLPEPVALRRAGPVFRAAEQGDVAAVRRRELLAERERVRGRPVRAQVPDAVLGLAGGRRVPARNPPQRGERGRHPLEPFPAPPQHGDVRRAVHVGRERLHRLPHGHIDQDPAVAALDSVNPGALSATAFTESSAATKPAIRGLSSGASSRPMLTCAST